MIRLIFIYLSCLMAFLSCCDSPTKTQDQEPELRLLWSYSVIDEPGNNISRVPPTILDDQIVIRPYSRILSLSKKDSSLNWAYNLPDIRQSDDSNSLLNDGNVIFGTSNLSGIYYAVDIETGIEKWKIDASDSLTFFGSNGDCVDENFVFLDDDDRNIIAFDKIDGSFIRRYELDKSARQVLCYTNMLIISMGSFDGSPSNSGEIRAINKQSGAIVWDFKTDKGGFFTAPLVEKNGILYSGTEFSEENTFVALNIKTGEVIWKKNNFLTSHFIISNDTLFINPAGGVIAVDAINGREIWRFDLGSASESNIEYLNGFVYLPNGSQLLIIDANTGMVAHTFISPDESVIWSLKSDRKNNTIYLQTSLNFYAYEGWSF